MVGHGILTGQQGFSYLSVFSLQLVFEGCRWHGDPSDWLQHAAPAQDPSSSVTSDPAHSEPRPGCHCLLASGP